MGIASIINSLKYIPASLGVKALEKVNPSFKNYFAKVAAYGLDTNRALEYIADRYKNSSAKGFENQLQQGEQQGNLRADEMASQSFLKNQAIPGQVARGAATLAGGLIGGVPGAALGLGAQALGEGGEQMAQPEAQQNQSQDPISFLAQYSPDLAKAVSYFSQQGLNPQEMAMSLRSTNYGPDINGAIAAIEKEHNLSFEEFLQMLFGGQPGQKGQNAPQQTQRQQPQRSQPQQQQAQQSQEGVNLSGLMTSLENLKKLL